MLLSVIIMTIIIIIICLSEKITSLWSAESGPIFSVIFIQSDNKWVIVWKLEKWSIHTTRAIWKFFQIVLALKVRAILREFQTSLVV